MKNSNEVRLSLEVLEDRMALSGAFGGAIDAGIPQFPPVIPVTVAPAIIGTQQTGFRSPVAAFNSQQAVNPFSAFQSQMQSFQAAQTAAFNQLVSEIQSILQQLNIQTFLVL